MSGEVEKCVRIADKHLEDRAIYCHMDRKQTLYGAVCRTGARAAVNSAGLHHGEEDCHAMRVPPEPRHKLEGP